MNIPASRSDFEKEFVTNIPSVERRDLFENYIRYSESLKALCSEGTVLQWINGSFVTKSNPGDIDMISFIDFDILKTVEKKITPYKYPNSYQNFGVDAYIMAIYPDNHPLYWMYVSDRAYWMDLFTKTKRNRAGTKWPKGFLEINY